MERALKRYSPIFILPTLLAFLIGFIIPFAEGLYLSFCKFTTVGNAKWTGLDNYKYALTDSSFIHSFWFTTAFAVVSILLINVLAFALALLLTRKLKGTNLFRTVFFMPNLIGGIVLGYIWQILINCVLSLVGKPLLALNTTAGYWGMIILMCWQQIGYMMIIYIAGLQNVPDDLIEAARIDGANVFQTFFNITLPYMIFVLTPYIITQFTGNINNFNVIWLLSRDIYTTSDQLMANANANEVDLLVTWLYRLTQDQSNYKMASVIGILVFVVTAVISLVVYNLIPSVKNEEDFQ